MSQKEKLIMTELQVRLPLDVSKALNEYSDSNFISSDWILKQAVIEYIKNHGNETYLTEYYSPLIYDYVDEDERETEKEKGIFYRDHSESWAIPHTSIVIESEDEDSYPYDLEDWIDVWVNAHCQKDNYSLDDESE
jgi:hypothetical protein